MNTESVRVVLKCDHCEETRKVRVGHYSGPIGCESCPKGVMKEDSIGYVGRKKDLLIDLLSDAIEIMDKHIRGESAWRHTLVSLRDGIERHWEGVVDKS